MLRTRLLSAFVMMPLVIYGVLFLDPTWFGLAVTVLMCIAGWEWSRLMGLVKTSSRALYTFCIFIVLCIAPMALLKPFLILSLLAWLLIFSAELTYPEHRHIWRSSVFVGALGFFVLVPVWMALISFVFPDGYSMTLRSLLLYILVLVWGADSAAYFAGKSFGKHKLCPSLSPGKTIEGVIGALICTFILVIMAGLLFHVQGHDWIRWILFSVSSAMISVIGDLGVSLFKRQQNLKDTGNLIPGHGGILDRIDGLLPAIAYFVFFCQLLNLRVSLI